MTQPSRPPDAAGPGLPPPGPPSVRNTGPLPAPIAQGPSRQAPIPHVLGQQSPMRQEPDQESAPLTRPVAVTVATVLGGVLGLALFATMIHTLFSISTASGLGVVVVLLLALVEGGFGVFATMGVFDLNHRRFPDMTVLSMASIWSWLVIVLGVVQSLTSGSGGPIVVTSVVWVGLAMVAATMWWLLSRPATVEWVKAVAHRSERQGHQSRRWR